ncbi:MAG: aldose 1-epimerase [Bacteroidota bacterium]
MYQVRSQKVDNFEFLSMHAPDDRVRCSINPNYGANLFSLEIKLDNQFVQLIDGYQSPTEFKANEGFKSGKLIPFPNRIKHGKYTFNDQAYQLGINFPGQGHAIHGLIYDSVYQAVHQQNGADRAILELTTHFDGVAAYPFTFSCSQRFELTKKGLSIQTTVENNGSSALPFGDGWHPYFCFGSTSVNELELKIPKCQQIEVDATMIPTGKLLEFNDFQALQALNAQEFDTGFVVDVSEDQVATDLHHPLTGLQLSVWQDANYPYLQIYTPPHRQSIAIEPMSCATDAFNNGQGLIVLEPGAQFTGQYGIQIGYPMTMK